MTDFTKGTGTAGTVRLRVTYTQSGMVTTFKWSLIIECDDPYTVIYSPGASWSVNIAGSADSGKFTWSSGQGSKTVASGSVSRTHGSDGKLASQSFSGTMGSTGTQGLGGANTASGSITPSRIAVKPDAPRSLAISLIDKTTARATFTAPADNGGASITQYRVRVGTSSNLATYQFTFGSGTSTTINFSGLKPGTKYYAAALAYNSEGWGDLSASVPFTTDAAGGSVWNGSAFVDGTWKVWSGTAWVDATVKVWNGSAWVDGS